MEKKDNTRRSSALPTLLQLRFLIELEKLKSRWGSASMIAECCGTTQATVSRYFKVCINNGYLKEDFQFTETGKLWLAEYKSLIVKLTNYLRAIGIPEQELENNLRVMIGNVEMHTLKKMVDDNAGTPVQRAMRTKKMVRFAQEEQEALEDCQVYFKLLCMENYASDMEKCFSMANLGFEREAYLRHDKEQDKWYLELTARDMAAHSRVSGENMIGHVATLKYDREGVLTAAEMENEKVKVPLEYCHFRRGSGLERVGYLAATFTCNVGNSHMPESTALLFFTF
ncbi:hypothetical protein [Hespellia stercorisuis]|uniref:MarR family transcriptional regulator n=1 Tax=Hespellia stercorisuis DSM 15480 TaxID=1121950 RepID=A0A1M6I423_9FIRM|nr:hypothetical protein [Hespellia stercorisuis]SHJ29104.1 hypothetical protein SAMN02745243_00215 [Hespellia stercorisuis DSM 15480]